MVKLYYIEVIPLQLKTLLVFFFYQILKSMTIDKKRRYILFDINRNMHKICCKIIDNEIKVVSIGVMALMF